MTNIKLPRDLSVQNSTKDVQRHKRYRCR